MNHITVRMAWHTDGWNGHVCKDPKANTYCCGRYSYPGDLISQERDIEWENRADVKGKHCSKLDRIPPCAYSINAFGTESVKAIAKPPVWFKDGTRDIYMDLPPSTVCIWPYRGMYSDDVVRDAGSAQKFDYESRLNNAKQYFDQIEESKSLLFYYSNYSNPFSDEESNRYALIGIGRLKTKGKIHYYDNVSEENKKKYAGGFVWQLPLTSNYPEEGMRLPFHIYKDNPAIMERLAIFPDVTGGFKYATGILSDDDALSIVEKFTEVVKFLIEIKDISENWQERLKWLYSLTAELWKARGAFPGTLKVMDYLGFSEGIEYFKSISSEEDQRGALSAIGLFLEGKSSSLGKITIDAKRKTNIQREWILKEQSEKTLLLGILIRFDLSKTQITNILSEDRQKNGITSSLSEITENPYLLAEQYIGDDYDDVISFYKIDHGILPSPDLGIEAIFEGNSPERFRVLCVDALKRTTEHSFLSDTLLINSVNKRIEYLPEWKTTIFTKKYFQADFDFLNLALTIREFETGKFIYLKETWEEERLIEKVIKDLSLRPSISLKTPILKAYFEQLLYNSDSPIAKKDDKEYKTAITQQADICIQLFNKPLCVVSGAAGTGKTTIIASILKAVEKAHGEGTAFLLLAPTGKATQRIREKTTKNASTIHSFLASKGWLNPNFTFKKSGGIEVKEYSTIIIDESSMIDLGMMACLFRSIDWNHVQRLILVGDPNQLPPIGKGKVFSDVIGYLLNENPDSLGNLEVNLRQMENLVSDKGTGILNLAEIYIQEKQENVSYIKDKKEIILKKIQEGGEIEKDLSVYFWKDTNELENLMQRVVLNDLASESNKPENTDPNELWQAYCRKKNIGGFLDASLMQVLSPYRNDNYGVDYLNTFLQKSLNSHNSGKSILDGISLGDKVIQIRNRPKSDKISAYNLQTKSNKEEIFNGEIGFTFKHKFDKYNINLKKFQVRFETRPNILYNYGFHKNENGSTVFNEPVEQNLELAYAISIHKAQGSEFERVYLVLPKRESQLLSMELLYTGITRASSHLTIFAQDDISSFTRLCEIDKSNLRRINSSIFIFNPLPDEIVFNQNKWYEDGKKISTLSKYYVRSKSEMNIANILSFNEIPFEYEVPLFAEDGTMFLPDFTVFWKGKKYFWEHVGRLDLPEYEEHWKKKKVWYELNFPDQLIITYESDSQTKDIQSILASYFN
ncbi:ATP-dependent DNA helicase [Leptospira sp. GIMC2001]|uniref:ATP-dependent DNA helicase n=1 Tax=Leptospira sp. GIMC2001 TaxID=1513297 RepID=UPI00234AE9EC|nr:AAA family ATPase [Leptospira sp. GIMC2001]WCL50761.1 AAA family ATPase [Leptospira sp. GIMC2001]